MPNFLVCRESSITIGKSATLIVPDEDNDPGIIGQITWPTGLVEVLRHKPGPFLTRVIRVRTYPSADISSNREHLESMPCISGRHNAKTIRS